MVSSRIRGRKSFIPRRRGQRLPTPPHQLQQPVPGSWITAYPTTPAIGYIPTIVWTTPPPLSALDQQIHVSSSTGNNLNHGLTSDKPVQTLAHALTLIRDGMGDRLLLKKGDTWVETIGNWTKSGAGDTRPIIITSYGTGITRPKIHTGTSSLMTNNAGFSNVWMIGIEVYGHLYTGNTATTAFNFTRSVSNWLIEDCYVHNYDYINVWQGFPAGSNRHTNMRARGCVFADAYHCSPGLGENCQGIYADGVDGLTVEYCYFDRCGWNIDVPGAVDNGARRAIYIQAGADGCTNVSVRYCIATRTDGFQLRTGGVFYGNICSRVKTGITMGYSYDPTPAGVTITCDYNCFLESRNDGGVLEDILGANFCNITSASTVIGNVFSQTLGNQGTTALGGVRALWMRGVFDDSPPSVPVAQWWPVVNAQLTMTGNVFYQAGRQVTDFNNAGQYTGTWIYSDNEWHTVIPSGGSPFNFGNAAVTSIMSGSNNLWSAGAPQSSWFNVGGVTYNVADFDTNTPINSSVVGPAVYPDPTRTLATYWLSIGGADFGSASANHDALCVAMRAQQRENWNLSFTALAIATYIRAGFGR